MLVTHYPTEKPADNITPSVILDHYRSLDRRSYGIMSVAERHYGSALRRNCAYLTTPEGRVAFESFLGWAPWSGTFVVECGHGSMFRALQVLDDGLDLEGLAQLLLNSGNLWQTFIDTSTTLDILRAPVSNPTPPLDTDTGYVIAVVPRHRFGTSKHSRYHHSSHAA